MTPNKHLSFKQDFSLVVNKIITEIDVSSAFPNAKFQKLTVKALWDTGAESSCITPEVSKKLNLISVDKVKIAGVNNVSVADKVNISLVLPNSIKIPRLSVMVCNLIPDIDMLIGMDIIKNGDFCISNGGCQTLFSYITPPHPNKTDLTQK